MTNDEIPNDEGMTNDRMTKGDDECGAVEIRRIGAYNAAMSEEENKPPYDLEERTARFGEEVIDFLKKVSPCPITNRLIDQLVGAGTSVGANYCEADDAVSKKDFRHKIAICKKEARESKFFLRMIARTVLDLRDEAKPLWQEANELHLIFAKIYRG